MYKFEKLTAWQESVRLAEKCYYLSANLPIIEKYGLSDQLIRAATSISLNIAEGSGSSSDKEFARYLYLSRKSLFEVISILKFIEKVYPRVDLGNVFEKCDTVGKLINGLINKLVAKS